MQDHPRQVDPLSVACHCAHAVETKGSEGHYCPLGARKEVRPSQPPKQVPFPRQVAATPQPLGAQPLRINDTKNPAAVAIELSGRPCSKASGMRVSASEAKTAPPAKASGNARCSSGNWANTPLPNTTAAVSSTAVRAQIPIANGAERPPRRIATAPTSDSGKFEHKMATSSARLPPPESKETPSARFSGTPSRVTAARSAKPTAALPACWVAASSCTRSVCCASAPERSSAASEERAGTSWGSPALL